MNDQIYLEEYNRNWSDYAMTEINLIRNNCRFSWVIDIQHFGSTAIIGLKSKPIIDIMIGVENIIESSKLIPILKSIGYIFWDKNPKQDRLFFVKGMPPFGKKRSHHVHVFEIDSYEWIARKAFRDYLNISPLDKMVYQSLKIKLASKFLNDREAYTDGKTEFIKNIVRKALSTNIADIAIESMSSDHIDVLVKSFSKIGWDKPESLFESYLQQQSNKTLYIWVARYKGNMAGYVILNLQSKYIHFKNYDIPEIMDLNVLPSFRNRAIASELLKIAETEAGKKSDIVGIGVGLYGGIDGGYGYAQRLYVKRGYIPDGRGITYNYQSVQVGDNVKLDDDLVLWFTKKI